MSGDLRPAHKGYVYQDLVTAFALVECLMDPVSTIVVDRKRAAGDAFDDITIVRPGVLVRRQIKWSEEGSRALQESDFTAEKSSLRIDRLVASHVALSGEEAEYRICVAWGPPEESDAIFSLISEAAAPPTIPGAAPTLFRLEGERIWPRGGAPVWALLGEQEVDRDRFMDLSRRLILETAMPPASRDLSAPQELESLLFSLLRDRVGVGEHPNRTSVQDVAARLLALATAARADGMTLRSDAIAARIGLRVDGGRLPQRSPVARGSEVSNEDAVAGLVRAADSGGLTILQGAPGVGKTWTLSKLVDELRAAGRIVAHHYCYLAPGDPEAESRVTTDALFANLIADLMEARPEVQHARSMVFASNAVQLRKVLVAAAKLGPVVLVVDGLDHISRVRDGSSRLAGANTDIVEQLTLLALPTGVSLVLGSQPGDHLRILETRATVVEAVTWDLSKVRDLAELLGINRAWRGAPEELERAVGAIHHRSGGNALLATFLARELHGLIEEGHPSPYERWAATGFAAAGSVSAYYEHLFGRAVPSAHCVADILGVLDFAVTESELEEIAGSLVGRHVPEALKNLRPVLEDVAGRGGLRIFHESFRRFILDRAKIHSTGLRDLLRPVVSWLDTRGFLQDGRSFAYLLPALARCGDVDSLLAKVGATFVSDALSWGHGHIAIDRNLRLTAAVAAASLRWRELARTAELFRSSYTCFEERMTDPLPFWEAFAAVRGFDALASRLTFEGAPTAPIHIGLVLCSQIADRGIAAPWDAYRAVAPTIPEDSATRRPDKRWEALVMSAALHGLILEEGENVALDVLLGYLVGQRLEDGTLRAVAERLCASMSDEGVALALGHAWPAAHDLGRAFRAALLAARAMLRFARGEAAPAADDAAGSFALAPRFGAGAVRRLRVQIPVPGDKPDPAVLRLGLTEADAWPKEEVFASWLEGVQELAHRHDEASLQELESLVRGEGWSRCWLRFVILVARGEALVAADWEAASNLGAQGFAELSRDVRPHAGAPRPSRMGGLRAIVLGTLSRGLALLVGSEAVCAAVDSIGRVVVGTQSQLQSSPSGPLLWESAIEVLLPYTSVPGVEAALIRFVEALRTDSARGPEVFDNLADVELASARAFVSIREPARAQGSFSAACVYLAGYGWRKDATFDELLAAIKPLLADEVFALSALARLQPLADAVVFHTDGKGTKYVQCHVLNHLSEVSPAPSATVVAHSAVRDGGAFGFRLEHAFESAVETLANTCEPRVAAAGIGLLRLEADREDEAIEALDVRLRVADRVRGADLDLWTQTVRLIHASVDDHHRELPAACELVERYLAAPECLSDDGPTDAEASTARTSSPPGESLGRSPQEAPPSPRRPNGEHSAFETLAWIRASLDHFGLRPGSGDIERVVNIVGYSCLEWIAEGRPDDAELAVRFLARETSKHWSSSALVGDLATGLEKHGCSALAAAGYALAYARARSDWGGFAAEENRHWIAKGLAVDPDATEAAFAGEVANMLADGGYVTGVAGGITSQLCAWGDPAGARLAWEAAYDVIRHRLPSPSAVPSEFVAIADAMNEVWTPEEAMVGLALARTTHPENIRRQLGLLTVARLVDAHPEHARRPLSWFLSSEAPGTAVRGVLQMLVGLSPPPDALIERVTPALLARASAPELATRSLARKLLHAAGTPWPEMPSAHCSPAGEATEDVGSILRVVGLDRGARIERLDAGFPGFGASVACRFDTLWAAPGAEAKAKARYDAFIPPGEGLRKWEPRFVGWEHELLETAVGEAAAQLVVGGGGDEAAEDQIAKFLLAEARVHAGVQASRIPRPELPRPQEWAAGPSPPCVLDEGDYAGWFRLGHTERELLRPGGRSWDPPSGFATVLSGLLPAAESGTAARPVGDCAPNSWFDPVAPAATGSLKGRFGPLCNAVVVRDVLGGVRILAPSARLLASLELRPGRWPGVVRWSDARGSAAIVCRTWSKGALSSGVRGENPILVGCELLLRPDLMVALVSAVGGAFVCTAHVNRTSGG